MLNHDQEVNGLVMEMERLGTLSDNACSDGSSIDGFDYKGMLEWLLELQYGLMINEVASSSIKLIKAERTNEDPECLI